MARRSVAEANELVDDLIVLCAKACEGGAQLVLSPFTVGNSSIAV
ncbi:MULTISPECIES: hypothetical protein [Ferrimicrobium]|jgi:hypothetical protein|nr:hypothetical protein [Ferrimicrobium sp.]